VTKADKGVAPSLGGATHIGNPGSSAAVGVVELTHDLVRAQLSEYLDGTLGESDRRRFDRHLAACLPCTAYLSTLRQTVRAVQALGSASSPKAPARARSRIVEQARRESESQQ
jgi:anti-sigma factor RsiW